MYNLSSYINLHLLVHNICTLNCVYKQEHALSTNYPHSQCLQCVGMLGITNHLTYMCVAHMYGSQRVKTKHGQLNHAHTLACQHKSSYRTHQNINALDRL